MIFFIFLSTNITFPAGESFKPAPFKFPMLGYQDLFTAGC